MTHFSTVTARTMDDYLEEVLPEVLEQGRPLTPLDREEPIDWQADDAPPWLGLRYPHEGPLVLLAVCRRNRSDGGADLRTFYPAALDGLPVVVQVVAVDEDRRAGEAIITAHTGTGLQLQYFDPLFCTRRSLYRRGAWLKVRLAGLVHDLELTDESGDKPAIKPYLLQTDDEVPDAGSFRSRVERLGYLELFDEGVYRLVVTLDEGLPNLGPGSRIQAILYVGEHQLAGGDPPRPGQAIRGTLWLQGVAQEIAPRPAHLPAKFDSLPEPDEAASDGADEEDHADHDYGSDADLDIEAAMEDDFEAWRDKTDREDDDDDVPF